MDARNRLASVVKAACDGTTVLTVNTRAARFVQAECNRQLRQSAETWDTPQVLPLRAWIERTFRDAQVAGATELALLNDRQSQSLWRQCVSGGYAMTDLLTPHMTGAAAARSWALTRAHRINITQAFDVTTQGRVFRGWARRYQSELESMQCTDSACVADELTRVVSALSPRLPERILLWGCGELTPQLAALFSALRETGVVVENVELPTGEIESARRIAFDDRSAELLHAAEYALNAVRKDPEARIGIILPDLRKLRTQLEAIFTSVLHPEIYLGTKSLKAFEVSDGEPLAGHSLISTAVLLLRILTDELTFEDIRELLRSPWLEGADEERYERARLARWLGGHLPQRVSLVRLRAALDSRSYNGNPRDAAELSRMRVPKLAALFTRLAKAARMPQRAPMSEWAQSIGRLLREAKWCEERSMLDGRSLQAYTRWLELLSEMASLDVTQGPVTFADAVEEIVRAVGSVTLAPANDQAPVQIMGAEEAQGSLFDDVWLCGMEDENWPPRNASDPFVPTHLQRLANVPGCTPESQAQEAAKRLSLLLGASPNAVLSFARQEKVKDRELRMAPAIEAARETVWSDFAIASAPRLAEVVSSAALEIEDDAKAPEVASEELLRRDSAMLERQSNCPFRAFAEFRLSASEVSDPTPGLDPRARGNIVDEMLSEFWSHALSLDNLRGLSAEQRAKVIALSVDKALRVASPAPQDVFDERIREIERERLAGVLEQWIAVEEKRTSFDKVEHQVKFDFVLAGVLMRGRIDRIDHCVFEDGEVIIDYKSGSASNEKRSNWKTPRPEKPQVPLYAVYRHSLGKKVVGVAFAKVRTAEPKYEPFAESEHVFGKVRKQSWTDLPLSAQLDEWKKEIETLVAEHVTGEAAVNPRSVTETCKHCHLHAVCRVSELTTIEDESEEDDDEQ